ncbi:MAG: hypothetical protein U0263_30815 [Polyangiaceae bacterium]
MQIVRLNAAQAAKFKGADRDVSMALFKKGELKKARDLSRRRRGELVRIVGPEDEVLAEVSEPVPR